jgi:integrase
MPIEWWGPAFVFASRNGTGLERKTARAALDRATKAAELTAPKPTLHDLRHSHASMLFALDHNLVAIQRRLGHRKPDTTLRVYTNGVTTKHNEATSATNSTNSSTQANSHSGQTTATSAPQTAP